MKYGLFVAGQLRRASVVVKTMGIKSGVRQAPQVTGDDVSYDAGTRWGGYGNYGLGGGYDATAEAKAKEEVCSASPWPRRKGLPPPTAQQIRQAMIAATTDIRQKMTEKFEAQF